MKISLYQLRRIIATELPKPGSINFKNAAEVIKIKVQIHQVGGWMTLVFHKSGNDWELEYFNREQIEDAITKASEIVTDRLLKDREPPKGKEPGNPGKKKK